MDHLRLGARPSRWLSRSILANCHFSDHQLLSLHRIMAHRQLAPHLAISTAPFSPPERLLSASSAVSSLASACDDDSGAAIRERELAFVAHVSERVAHLELVLHAPSGRRLARKKHFPQGDFSDVRRAARALKRGAKELRTMRCEHLVQVFGTLFNADSGQVSVLTEFCDRGSLRELKDMQAPIPEDIVASVSWQILKGLEYLGANDMMHGNLTLSNVLLTSEGYVKLTDFSVLKRNENPAACWIPEPSKHYFSPEAVHGEPVDMKSDIWSLGHVQLELTRTGPVHATALTPFELLTLIADGHVPSLPTGQFSEEFEDVSRKCLEMNPENRASVQELLDHVWCREAEECGIKALADWLKLIEPDESEPPR